MNHQLIKQIHHIVLGLLNIGGRFTIYDVIFISLFVQAPQIAVNLSCFEGGGVLALPAHVALR